MLEPDMKVQITEELKGSELYGGDDPEELKQWCGKVVTVSRVQEHVQWMVYIQEDKDACFYMEEIECIVDDGVEIEESDEPLCIILGGEE